MVFLIPRTAIMKLVVILGHKVSGFIKVLKLCKYIDFMSDFKQIWYKYKIQLYNIQICKSLIDFDERDNLIIFKSVKVVGEEEVYSNKICCLQGTNKYLEETSLIRIRIP